MRKNIIIILAVSLFVAMSYSVSGAQYIADSPFTASYLEVFPNWDGYGNSAVLTYSSTDNLGSYFMFLLDPAGIPIATPSTFGWVYLFADVLADGTLAVYGSNSGLSTDWVRIF